MMHRWTRAGVRHAVPLRGIPSSSTSTFTPRSARKPPWIELSDRWWVVLAATDTVLNETVFLESPSNPPPLGYALPIRHVSPAAGGLCVGVASEQRCRAGGAARTRWSSRPVSRHAVGAEALLIRFKYVTPG